MEYSFLGIPVSFFGGILVALTPCVAPLLPVALSIITQAALVSKQKISVLSIAFVLGITVNYVTLGIIAAVFGVLSAKFISPFFIYLSLGIVFILLGLSFFDLFHFSIFSGNCRAGSNLFSMFILGFFCGISMLPCAFPVLGAILSVISIKKNILYGTACFFSFSLGYGVIFFLVGSWAGFVKKISERKHWIAGIKKVLGIVMIVCGVYFLMNLLRAV